jgi:hypothetical protein
VTRRNELGDARTALEATATRVSERDTALTLTREELVRSQRDLRDARLELESARLALRNALTGPP